MRRIIILLSMVLLGLSLQACKATPASQTQGSKLGTATTGSAAQPAVAPTARPAGSAVNTEPAAPLGTIQMPPTVPGGNIGQQGATDILRGIASTSGETNPQVTFIAQKTLTEAYQVWPDMNVVLAFPGDTIVWMIDMNGTFDRERMPRPAGAPAQPPATRMRLILHAGTGMLIYGNSR